MKGEHSAMPDAAVAHYHLPGLFEFYDFYRAFLPLYRRHREYFYDWCDIASLYGAPEGCLWGGGRIGSGNCDPRDVLALTREYGISARLTFSNSLLRPEHLADRGCNRLCRLFAGSAGPQTASSSTRSCCWSTCAACIRSCILFHPPPRCLQILPLCGRSWSGRSFAAWYRIFG